MKTITLYRYVRRDGGTTVSPIMPTDSDYSVLYRLIADEGMILINGDSDTCCVDTEYPEDWTEIPGEVNEDGGQDN